MNIIFIVSFLGILFLYAFFLIKKKKHKKNELKAFTQDREFFYLLEEGVLFLNEQYQGLECNRACCRVLGCRSSDLLNKNFFSIINFPRSEILEKCRELLKRLEHSPFELRDSVFYKGEHDSFVVDIVVAKINQYERVLILKDTHQDYQTFKMGKEFISNASHELRTPITIIKGFIETLQDLPEVSDAMLEGIFEKILRSCKRMDDIVKNLLILTDLDHLFKPNMKSFDLLALLDNCKHSILELYPETTVEIISLEKEKMTEADPSLLELAMMNLLQNAVKYSPTPATIQIKLEEGKTESLIKIIDNGCGIPEENLPHIFNRFYSVNKTLSRKLGGAGLGLSIVKNIIEKHQGNITAESNPDGGTIFTVALPNR